MNSRSDEQALVLTLDARYYKVESTGTKNNNASSINQSYFMYEGVT
jgi:hypothetical protein